ncbi:MAG: rhodanese-like domain-containing protein [Candidatus Margulisiibacteriota bacterium]
MKSTIYLFNLFLLAVTVLLLAQLIRDWLRRSGAHVRQMITLMDPLSVYDFIQRKGEDYVLIDVRSPREYSRRHIRGAINMSVMDLKFSKELRNLPKKRIYILYGQGNSRCQRAFDQMKNRRFPQVYMMAGGLLEWSLLDLPVQK